MNLDREAREYLEAFERGTIPPEGFDHAAHVYAAWCCLGRYGEKAGQERFVAALRRFVRLHNAEPKYHETITRALLGLIAGRATPDGGWESFRRDNEDLLEDGLGLLLRHYSEALLFSDTARTEFVEPDRRPLPGHREPYKGGQWARDGSERGDADAE